MNVRPVAVALALVVGASTSFAALARASTPSADGLTVSGSGGPRHEATHVLSRLAPSAQPRLSAAARDRAHDHGVAPAVQATSAPLTVGVGATAVGVTWTSLTSKVLLEWRFDPQGGPMGDWQELPVAEHGPDESSQRESSRPAVSEPLLISEPGRVELRLVGDSSVAQGAPKATVTSYAPQADSKVAESDATSAAVAAPTVLTRAQWGAHESLRNGSPSYGAVKGALVHHTVNANNYTASQVPGLIRAIYEYHVLKNGWNDIGYNFLIDRFGRTWEGRYGGIARPVVGAHSPGVNSWTTSAAVLGDFTASGTSVPTAVTTAYRNLFAWKAQLHQFDPSWTVNLGGEVQRSISGHRDNIGTECPGDAMYVRIPALKTAVDAAVGAYPALTVRRDADNAGGNDVVALDASGQVVLATGEAGKLQEAEPVSGIPGAGSELQRVVGDWTGDGAVDVTSRNSATGDLMLHAGNGTGGFAAPVKFGHQWRGIRLISGVGDLSGDGKPDLLATTFATSDLILYMGNGRGGFIGSKVIGWKWNGIRSIVGVGDWDADGRPDVLGITGAGAAIVYRGTGAGTITTGPTLNGISWKAPSVVTGVGDITGDGRVDLVAKGADGAVRVAAGTTSPSAVRWVAQDAATVAAWRLLTPLEG